MAIRFCKGKEADFNLDNAVVFDKQIFEKVHSIFLNSDYEYIPIVDKNRKYICCCYDDKNIDGLFNKIFILFNTEYSKKKIVKKYKRATIVSLNELSLYIYTMLKINNCRVNVYGDLWNYLEILCNSENDSNCIYSEGNPGLSLEDMGYYKNTFPFNEYYFFENLYNKTINKNKLYNRKKISNKRANKILTKNIKSGKPFMAARLGNTEAMITSQYFTYYTETWLKYLYTTSGFYSQKEYSENVKDIFIKDDVDLYAIRTIESIKNCDINMCCFANETPLINKFSHKKSINTDWYAFYTNPNDDFWLNSLASKKVLIISSFNNTIKSQLFKKNIIYPKFKYPNLNLKYYNFPITCVGKYNSQTNFFENYNNLLEKIKKIDFDIALIAAGAYGYLLASDIKKMGKQSVELCSGLYPLFGIKTKTQLIIRKISSMYNKNWVFPNDNKPKDYMKIEKGAYWE